MNVIFISPHFPPNFAQFSRALKDAGARVLGIGDTTFEELPHTLKDSLTDYRFVPDMQDFQAMKAVCREFMDIHGEIHRIESMNEFWLEMDARLRREFGVFGQKPEALRVNRMKSGMKDRFRQAGIPCAEGECYENPDKIRALAERSGFPLVFKPDLGVGAFGSFKVKNARELETAFEKDLRGYIVEEMLTGDLVSFDGLTDRDGEIVFFTSHIFNNGIMDVLSSQGPMHYYNLRNLPMELERLGRKTVEAFDIRERFFHIEYFRKDSEYKAMEVNVRPPGGFTMDMMNISCDIDLYRLWAELVMGRTEEFTYKRKYHAAHVARRTMKRYLFEHEELLNKLGSMITYHMPMPGAFAEVMGDYTYLLRTPDQKTLEVAISMVERER